MEVHHALSSIDDTLAVLWVLTTGWICIKRIVDAKIRSSGNCPLKPHEEVVRRGRA